MTTAPKITWPSLFTAAMYGFMYFPIIVLAVYSFNASRYSASWEGFSLKWYRSLFQDSRIFSALMDSLTIAVVAVAVSAVLGTMMAIGLAKYRFRGKGLYRGIAYLPLIIPDIAIAVATLVFLTYVAIPLSLGTIIVSHVVFCLAYIAVVVASRLQNLDPNLEEAALDLGATPFQAMMKVLIPQLAPGILAGCLLAFVLSMDDLLISSFTAGGGANPLPLEIFSRVRTGVKPDINALSVVLILGSALLSGMAEYLRYRSERQRRG
ncbi:MAG: ABC transporter permease [Leptolyngbyaceae cyanobacterium SM2_5_2]|nr:ABC transporter permease [Leptolyngbyaceae cyanobacterium SM2_5_2]